MLGAWQDALELATFRKEIANNTVSNMRTPTEAEQGQKQRVALQGVGLLVEVEASLGGAGEQGEQGEEEP